MRTLRDGLDRIARLLLWLGVAAGFLMMVHVAADVIGRSVFAHPLPGTTEIVSGYYMVAAAFLPWAYIATKDDHIKVELFTLMLSQRSTAWLDLVVKIATAAYIALFTWQAFAGAEQATRSGETWEASTFYLAVWPSRWLLPVAGFVMAAYLIVRAIMDVMAGPERAGTGDA